MRKLIILVSAAASTLVAAPAFAQDQKPTFTGFRIEGLAGWDHPRVPNDHANGFLYGVGAGYDYQAGRVVFGVEGEASDSTAKRCVAGVLTAGDDLCARAGRDLYVGGRVGAVVAPTTLLYAKAGYTNGRIDADYTTVSGVGDFRDHRDLNGFRVGGGIEQAIGRNAYVKAEYRYSNYEQNVDRHQVVAGFGFRF
ncbi:MAG TPA: porin family protein [Allosphingosinicella sp.]|nr:porin family protein [Allosphingosinicella sp.]